jgi:EAL domain-containing protein (putative c-di-GMP-specific phosphodiesterase class I)
MGSAWIYPFIVMGDVLRASGASMNAKLETSPQMGCALAQGNLFSPPLPAEEFSLVAA